MVKFSDAIFQDAYLCSLRRQHDDKYDDNLHSSAYQSTTNASGVANGRDIGYSDKRDDIQEMKERYQEDIYTSTTFKSGSNKHNQYHDTTNNKYNKQEQQSSINYNKHVSLVPPPQQPPPMSTNIEEYTTPIIQRSKARQIERNSFLDWADSQLLGYKATSTSTEDAGSKDGGNCKVGGVREDRGRDREVSGGKSIRMKKLWDFNNIDTSYVKRDDEQRDDNNDNISLYKPTSHIRDPSFTNNTNLNSNHSNSTNSNPSNSKLKKEEVWTASKIRQESRHDITKQLNVDLNEIEMFMSSMKERIKMYGTSGGGGGGKDGSGKEGRVAAVEDESDKGNDKERGLGVRDKDMGGNKDTKSANNDEEVDKLHLTSSLSSSSEDIPTDDGYGKQLRSPHYYTTSHNKSFNGNNNREINNLINKFQSTRIKQSRHYLVQGDELMNSSMTNINNDDRVGEHRTYREPIMTMKKQAIKIATYTGMNQQDDMTTKKDNGSSRGAAKKSGYDYTTMGGPREVRLNRMQELKKKHQLVIDQDRKNEPPPPPPKEDYEKKTDIDSWWDEHKLKQDQRQQRHVKDRGCLDTNYNIDDELERWWKEKRRNDTPNKTTFAELEEEPTLTDSDQSTFKASTTIKGTLTLPPLSPMNTIPTKKEVEGSSSSTSSSKSKPYVKSHLSHTFRLKSRQLGSPLPVQRGSSSSIDGPLLTSTSSESSTLTDGKVDWDVEDTNNEEVEEQSASSSSLSILSEEATEEKDRCQSLAQSTLSMLLSRIDEAKASFTQALLDGDAVKQAELASLLSRLGEAAVTMRKLEQTAWES